MDVSVLVAVICFLFGSGLIILGAFFIRRLIKRQVVQQVLLVLLPVACVELNAILLEHTEVAVGLILGTVAFNLAAIGGLMLFYLRLPLAKTLMSTFWVGCGWLVCMTAGRVNGIGRFGGLGLCIVGIAALWWYCCQKKIVTFKNTETECINQGACVKLRWVFIVSAILLVALGAWLVVHYHTVVATIVDMPVSVFSQVILAPICVAAVLVGIRSYGEWQPQKTMLGLSLANIVLSTIGLGFIALFFGVIHLTQSMLVITLPWIAGMAVLLIVGACLPQKTARWWGGLIVVMLLGCIISLMW